MRKLLVSLAVVGVGVVACMPQGQCPFQWQEYCQVGDASCKGHLIDANHWQSLLNLVLINAFDARDPVAAQRFLDELTRRYPEIPNTGRIQEQISSLRAGG